MIRAFAGKDTFRSHAAYMATRTEMLRQGPVTVVRDEELTIARMMTVLHGQSLFGDTAAVALEDLTRFTGADGEAVAELLSQVPKTTTVLLWESGTPNERLIVWKAIRAHADAVEMFVPLSERERATWIQQAVQERGARIEPAATEHLARTGGEDLWRLSNEIEKLCLFAADRPITADDVDRVGRLVKSADPFLTVRAIVAGRQQEAIGRLVDARRQGEDPRLLFSLVVREVRLLCIVRDALDRSRSFQSWTLARDLHIPHTAVEALRATAERTTSRQLRTLFDRLIISLHALNTGRAEPEDLLDYLVMQGSGIDARTENIPARSAVGRGVNASRARR